jgi:hypothetical protein
MICDCLPIGGVLLSEDSKCQNFQIDTSFSATGCLIVGRGLSAQANNQRN